MFNLKDKVVMVTGAGRGIGRGIALAFAKEGCSVIVSDINEDDCQKVFGELAGQGIKSIGIKCDVSNPTEVEKLFIQAGEKFGKIDILVNNAGIYPFVSFEQMKESDWDKVMNINLKSIFLCSKEVLKFMPNGGRIVNISSIASFVGFVGLIHYCASKGGINAMVRALALELAAKKITVNAVAPGAIDTPGASSTEEIKKQTISAIPLARMGEPQDIASAVIFLASDEASYITGQILIVDGGWTLR